MNFLSLQGLTNTVDTKREFNTFNGLHLASLDVYFNCCSGLFDFYFSSLFDEEIQSSRERLSARNHHRSEVDIPTSNPTSDVFSLFSKHLYNALEKQKKEIFTVFEVKISALNQPTT